MESFERELKKYAILINVNLVRATLNEAAEFSEYLNEAIIGTDVDIVVNLSDCQHLDSTFLGVLVSGYKRLKNKNRNMVIIEPTDQSRVFLTLNSIGKIFPLYDSVNSALADIENKKMLENVVDNIDSEIPDEQNEPELEAVSPVKDEIILNDITEETPIAEEVQLFNMSEEAAVTEEIHTNEIQEEVTASEQELFFKEEINLENENLSTVQKDESQEIINTNNMESVEANLEEEIHLVPQPKPLYSDENFRKGSVDWAFGFN